MSRSIFGAMGKREMILATVKICRLGDLTMHLGRISCSSLILTILLTTQSVYAEQLKIKGVVTQWAPLVLFAQPGDTVTFVNMLGHDTVSIDGMIPAGSESWKSKLGAEAYTITVEKEGAYIYKCTPHMSAGMVGAIVVGDAYPTNLADIEQSLPDVKFGRNMVKRTIRKMNQALAKRAEN